MFDPTRIVPFMAEHKVAIGAIAAAAATPTLVMVAPEVYDAVAGLPPQAKFAIAGVAGVAGVGAVAATGRRTTRAAVRVYRSFEKMTERRREAEAAHKLARLRTQAFRQGSLPGAERVVMVERSAGNISNISRERSTLPWELERELAAAKRTVLVIGDTAPGIELDAEPDLVITEAGEAVAEFRKSPVRDDIGDAIRRTQQWRPRQEPYLTSFLNHCEVQVGVHISAPGCTSLTDGLHGLGPRVQGTEANFHIYVHDPRDPADPCQTDSSEQVNGHREAEVPALVLAGGDFGGPPLDPDLLAVMNVSATRQMGRRETEVDRRDVRERLLGLEEEYYDQAARDGDRVFLVSNFNGVKSNWEIRSLVDVIESASLRNYHPLGESAKFAGLDYGDVSHVAKGAWIPSVPFAFGDSHAAQGAAKEITTGQWQSLFYGFAPDQLPLQYRLGAATFVTGHPRAGEAFIEALERALPIQNTVIAHWNTAVSGAHAVFCVPAAPREIRAAGLRFDPQAFAKQAG